MYVWWFMCLGLLATPPLARADTVEILSTAYSMFVYGGRVLHDVAGGMGLVAKMLRAFDYFLDKSAVDSVTESLEETEGSGETPSSITPDIDKKVELPSQTSPLSPSEDPRETQPSDDVEGCGVLGLHITDTNLPVLGLTRCCNFHDACYESSCSVKKRSCDRALGNCLKEVCDDLTLDWDVQKSCQKAVKLLYSGTMALSSQQFKDAQDNLFCRKQGKRRGRR